jgi:hypothetical protein
MASSILNILATVKEQTSVRNGHWTGYQISTRQVEVIEESLKSIIAAQQGGVGIADEFTTPTALSTTSLDIEICDIEIQTLRDQLENTLPRDRPALNEKIGKLLSRKATLIRLRAQDG